MREDRWSHQETAEAAEKSTSLGGGGSPRLAERYDNLKVLRKVTPSPYDSHTCVCAACVFQGVVGRRGWGVGVMGVGWGRYVLYGRLSVMHRFMGDGKWRGPSGHLLLS